MITLCMIVKNEEALLGPLLARAKTVCEHMVITDTGSTDRTPQIITSSGARLIRWPFAMDYAKARNVGLEVVTTPWAWSLDADEWPSDGLMAWIGDFQMAQLGTRYHAVTLRRENKVAGAILPGSAGYERHIRIFTRHLRYVGRLHEHIECEPDLVVHAPDWALLLHHKTQARQEAQNVFYAQWPEQQAAIRRQADAAG